MGPELEDGDVVVGRVFIYRVLTEDGGMHDQVFTDDAHGHQLDMPTAVGMTAVAQHTLLCEASDS